MASLDNKFWTHKLAYPRFTSLGHLYSTKGKRENFVLLSKANVGKTVALIGWQVSCVMTSPAEIARLGLPNVYDRSSDGSNFLNVEKKQY